MNADTAWLSCGVLRAEIEALRDAHAIDGELHFFDSMLHMQPDRLERTLEPEVERLTQMGRRVILVYGDCCARMLDLARRPGVGRVAAINCAQMLVGHARYRELMRANAFLLLPEWAARWPEAMRHDLGLVGDLGHALMRDTRRELVYLDTGLCPVPEAALLECSRFAGLPTRVEKAPLDHLLRYLTEAEARARAVPAGVQKP
jgi:hypothetical protein